MEGIRKSIRGKRTATSTTPEHDQLQNKGSRQLRSANKSPVVQRRSNRKMDSLPHKYLLGGSSESEEKSPSPQRPVAKSGTRTPSTRGRRKKESESNSAELEFQEEEPSLTVRSSKRTPKPRKRLIDQDNNGKTIYSSVKNDNNKHTPSSATVISQNSSTEVNMTADPPKKRGRKKKEPELQDEDNDNEEHKNIETRRKSKRVVAAAIKLKIKSPIPPSNRASSTSLSRKRPSAKSKNTSDEDSDAEGEKLNSRQVTQTTKAAKISSSMSQQQQPPTLEWKFNVYGIPKCPLPCRERQFQDIWKFLFENVTEKNSGCMYVSGVPGTGKTVIVQAVVDTLQKLTEDKKNNKKNIKFKYLYVNGLALASPDKIWKRMYKGLELQSKSKGVSTKECLKRLNSRFDSTSKDPVILVVDELDQILDKQQSILYQLLEWSSHASNIFSFVAIFNTMNLPEHGLAMRNYSRMGFKRSVFTPYKFEELHTIVSNMLETFSVERLNSEAVSLLSRKVAAISGDARRALEIARRAMEIAEGSEFSGIQAVSSAFKEIFSSAKIETIKHTSLLEQLVLRSICDEIRCSGMEEVLVAKIYENVIPKAVYEGMKWTKDEILKAMMRLTVMGLLILEDNSPSIHKRILLKVPVEDVNFALGIHNEVVE